MILNYLKLALRLLFRNPFLTFINIAGLSIGLATFMMLWPLAEYELNSDKFHKDSDRIILVGIDYRWTNDGKTWNNFIAPLNMIGVVDEMEKTFGQVEASCFIVPQSYYSLSSTRFNSSVFVSVTSDGGEKKMVREENTALASANLFEFFTIPLIKGNRKTVLVNPNTVVLSQSMAVKYFGRVEAIGKTIYLNDTIPLQVTGIFEDLPHNSHMNFNMVISAAGYPNLNEKDLGLWYSYCYLRLKKGSTLDTFNEELSRHQQSLYSYVKRRCDHCQLLAHPQQLTDVVFSKQRASVHNYKSKFLLEALAIVAFTVLGFAWINYISLSVNSLNKRLHEIGTRKSVGAGGNDFLVQFLIESLLMNVISFGIAITMVQIMSGIAQDWFSFYIPSWREISIKTTALTIVTLGVGIAIATFCPLILVIKRRPTELFKKFKSHIRSGKFSASLVTVQYSIATVLLVWIGAVYFQLNFIMKKDIGIEKEGLVVAESPLIMSESNINKISSFLAEARRIPGVKEATTSFTTVADPDEAGINVQLVGSKTWFGADSNGGVDESFLPTFNIQLIAGRNFRADNPSDKKSILLSEVATRRLGFDHPEEAVGQNVLAFQRDQTAALQVIGVFEDYEFRPFFSDVTEKDRGVALTYKSYAFPDYKPMKITFKVDLEKMNEVINPLETLYSRIYQENMKWNFLDEKLRMQYVDEHKTKNQLAFFSILAVGITCLGLLGMISNKVVEKTKEIGIRKVLGARMHQIAQLLLNTTVRQVLLANLIGIPLAYYFVQQYLLKFSERMEMQWWHYTIPALVLMMIMLATIASVLYKAGRTNPTESLRYE